jgi:ATP-dependent helicase/nuclease subunit A
VVLDDDEGERVWVGPFASDDDKTGERKRETEETKRLLYVALTRARDRLYLGTVLKDGRAVAGNGSLAKVLPTGFVQLFEMAGRADPDTAWTCGSRIYPFRVCPPAQDPPLSLPRHEAAAARAANFAPLLVDPSAVAIAVTGANPEQALRSGEARVEGADRLLGTLVHRMLQRAPAPEVDLPRMARALLLDDEIAGIDDIEAALDAAAATYRAIAERDDVRALLQAGERLHEVPFSFRRGGELLRGTIDCLVIAPGGPVTVVEFKTGRKRPEHQAQLDVYVDAARALFPGAAVEGRLVYP